MFSLRRTPDSLEATPPGGVRRRHWPGVLQILVVIALVLIALRFAQAPDEEDANDTALLAGGGGASKPLVSIIHPRPADTVLTITATGSVAVRNHVALTPQVGGRVVSISPALRAGGAFTAGEELLIIDRRDFELALEQARADIAQARSNLMLEQAQGGAARANYQLLNPNVDSARVPSLIARVPQIAQARARLAAAQARAEVAILELQRAVFSLPFNGRITASSAEIGQVLGRGQSFGQAFALDAVEVVVPVSPDDLKRLEPAVGRTATVFDGYRGFAAVVERVGAELDARTRFATLFLTFVDSHASGVAPRPSPGTFVDVDIEGPKLANTLLLPEAAEQPNGAVWVVTAGALRAVTPTTLGRTGQGWIVAAFDIADGVVFGAVPGARPDLAVDTAPLAAGG